MGLPITKLALHDTERLLDLGNDTVGAVGEAMPLVAIPGRTHQPQDFARR